MGNGGGRYFLGAQESTKEGCVDVKDKLIKLEGGTAAFQLKISIFYVYNTGSLLLSSLKKVTSPLSPRTPVLHHPFPAHRYFS